MAPDPRPFQNQGIRWLQGRTNALLADVMGLGKSMQALIAAKRIEAKRVLIVAPKSACIGWQREAAKWTSTSLAYLDNKKVPIPEEGWVLAPWSQVTIRTDLLHHRWDVLVVDEAHLGKSSGMAKRMAKRSVAVFGGHAKVRGSWQRTPGLCGRASRRWLLTGTPMPNRPVELYPLLKALRVSWAQCKATFGDRYCRRPNQFSLSGFDYEGAKNLDELWKRLHEDIMLRRTPEMVPGQLPEVDRLVVSLVGDCSGAEALISSEVRRAIEAWSGEDALPAFTEMSEYRRELGLVKAQVCARWAEDWLDGNVGERIVLFCHHRSTCEELRSELWGYNPIVAHGGNASVPRIRQAKVDAFADGASRVFIGSTGACGTGMNGLHRATSVCAFVEQEWTPGEIEQAIGRVRRIDGVGRQCLVYFLVIGGALEEHIMATLAHKSAVQRSVLDVDVDAAAASLDLGAFKHPQVETCFSDLENYL